MEEPKLNAFFFYPPVEANALGHIMEEVYKTQIFYPFTPEKKEGSVVVDLGANLGLTAYYFAQRFETVYAVEPAKEHMDVLKHMIEFNGLTNVKPFKFAVSMLDKPEEKFYHYTNRTMNSLYGNIQGTGGLAQTGFELVPLKRLDTFFKEEGIKHVDLLKLDIEGVEFEVIGSDSFTNVAPMIDNIVVEVHGYSGRNPQQIVDGLKLRGFDVSVIPHEATLLVATRKK